MSTYDVLIFLLICTAVFLIGRIFFFITYSKVWELISATAVAVISMAALIYSVLLYSQMDLLTPDNINSVFPTPVLFLVSFAIMVAGELCIEKLHERLFLRKFFNK